MPSRDAAQDRPAGPRRRTARRAYHSPKRRQQSERTRQRIVEAGAGLVHEFSSWDWKQLTYRAVGERAAVSERTVYRYFPTEDTLKRAVMQHLVREAGVDLEALKIGDFAETVARVFRYLSTFDIEPAGTPEEPTFVSMDSQRRQALLTAVARELPAWPEAQREAAAAALDIFWNLPLYERLVTVWGFDQQRASATVGWVIGLIEAAIKAGSRPG